ncbi:MAG TPA: hypothetical protein VH352_16045 [Pseudonocardiaceae bacterium]|nr:hypothetical protein [Pseudonocardiaceae bacterium]
MNDHVELLVTVVLAAEGEHAARSACRELMWQVDGRIVESTDCSDEEPGCWSVTLRVPSEERTTHNVAAPLARAVRQFVRGLGPDFVVPTVSCEPPTAWTVLDDPDAVQTLVAGAERLLVEAWYGGDPYPRVAAEDLTSVTPEPKPTTAPEPEVDSESDSSRPIVEPTARRHRPTADATPAEGCRLTLRVDVATSRAAGAEWQARALASRISRTATLAGTTEHDGVLSVLVDLGTAHTPVPQTVLTAVSALDRPGWSTLRWEGETAITTWTAKPRPESGITELELSSSPQVRRRRG